MLPSDILSKTSKEFNLSNSEINRLYSLWYKEIRDIIDSFDPYDDNNVFTDINIPYFGKLIINPKKTKIINGRSLSKKNNADKQSDTDDC